MANETASAKETKSKKLVDAASIVASLCKDMDTVHTVADEHVTDFLSTGHMGIDYTISGKWIGGGIPRRKLIEVFGPAASAKSALMYLCCASMQRMGGIAAIIDVEGGRNEEFMRKLGINIDQLIIITPKYSDQKHPEPIECFTIETCFEEVRNFVAAIRTKYPDVPLFIGIDSIAAVPSFNEWKTAWIDKKTIKEDQGRRAKLIGTWQRTLNSNLRTSDTTLMVLNQIRERIGVMFGPTETTTSGRSTEFYSDLRIEIRRRKTIKRTTFKSKSDGEGEDKSLQRKLGGFFRVACEKNRQSAPFRVIEAVEIYFEQGIAPMSGLFDLMLMDELIMKDGGAYYSIVDPDSRNEAILKAVPGTRFMRKDIEEGSWVFDHPEFFKATNPQDIKDFIDNNAWAHRFSLALRRALKDKRAEIQEDESEDDDPAQSQALKKLTGKGAGRIIKPRPADPPADETGDEEL